MGNEESVQLQANNPNTINPNFTNTLSYPSLSSSSKQQQIGIINSQQQQQQQYFNSQTNNQFVNNNNLYDQHRPNATFLIGQKEQQTAANMNMLSSMTSNLTQKSANNPTSSMFNSIGQLSTSFPNSIKPLGNQLINQFHPGSFSGISGIGGGAQRNAQQQQQQQGGPGPPGQHGSMQSQHGQQQHHAPTTNNTSAASSSSSSNINKPLASPAVAVPSQVPEVDLSGLTEEEKQMIQSVMARAQQDTQSSMPLTPVPTPNAASQQPTTTATTTNKNVTNPMAQGSHPSMVQQQQQQQPGPYHHPPPSSDMMKSATQPSTAVTAGGSGMLSQQQQQPSNQFISSSSSSTTTTGTPSIGYPEQRRVAQKNMAPCSICRRDYEQMNLIKCSDCLKMFCQQCGQHDSNRQVRMCNDCYKRRQMLPPGLVPPAPVGANNNTNIANVVPGMNMTQANHHHQQQQQPSTMINDPINSMQMQQSSLSNQQQQQQQQTNDTFYNATNTQQQITQNSAMTMANTTGQTNQMMTNTNQQQQNLYGHPQQTSNQLVNQTSSDQQQMYGPNQPQQQQPFMPQQTTMGATGTQAGLGGGFSQANQRPNQICQTGQTQQYQMDSNNQLVDAYNDPSMQMMNQQQPGKVQTMSMLNQNQQQPQTTSSTMATQQQCLQQQQSSEMVPFGTNALSSNSSQQQPTTTTMIGQQPISNEHQLTMNQQQQAQQMANIQNNQFNLMNQQQQQQQNDNSLTDNNNDLDDYGYLNFEIDEEYERLGEYDDDEEEEEDDDEEDDDEEEDEVYGGKIRFRFSQQSGSSFNNRRQQTTNNVNNKYPMRQMRQFGGSRVSNRSSSSITMSPFHNQYMNYHDGISNVYTIPEEDEEHDLSDNPTTEQNSPYEQPTQTSKPIANNTNLLANTKRRQSVAIMNIVPSSSSSSSSTTTTSTTSTSMVQKQTLAANTTNVNYKGRSNRSNSEPFLANGEQNNMLMNNIIKRARKQSLRKPEDTLGRANKPWGLLSVPLMAGNSQQQQPNDMNVMMSGSGGQTGQMMAMQSQPLRATTATTVQSDQQQMAMAAIINQTGPMSQQQPNLYDNQQQQQQMITNDMTTAQQQQQRLNSEIYIQHQDPMMTNQQTTTNTTGQQQPNQMNQTNVQQMSMNQMNTTGNNFNNNTNFGPFGTGNQNQMDGMITGNLQQPSNQMQQQLMPQQQQLADHHQQQQPFGPKLNQMNQQMQYQGQTTTTTGTGSRQLPSSQYQQHHHHPSHQIGQTQPQQIIQTQQKLLPSNQTSSTSSSNQNSSLQQQQFDLRHPQQQQQQRSTTFADNTRNDVFINKMNATSATNIGQTSSSSSSDGQHHQPSMMHRSMPLYNMAGQLQQTSGSPSGKTTSQQPYQMIQHATNASGNLLLLRNSPHQTTTPVTSSQLNARAIQQQHCETWSHSSTELSPILDVSPSIEAAEAQDILGRRRNTLQSLTNKDRTATNFSDNMGVTDVTSISGMIDDFNRAIETLSLNSITNKNVTAAAAAAVGPNQIDRHQNIGSRIDNKTTGTSTSKVPFVSHNKSTLTRRASTGQTECLDHYRSLLSSNNSSNATATQLHNQQSTSSSLKQTNKTLETSSSLLNKTVATSGTTASNTNDLEQLKQQKALLVTNAEIEQQLQKQQQILIQQQQQFLQIQLEQQRLQNQIHEQMSTAAQIERQQQQSNKQTHNQQNNDYATGSNQRIKDDKQKQQHSTTSNEKNREIAVNTDRDYNDSKYNRQMTMMKSKQDKQVSTSSTPAPGDRGSGAAGGGRSSTGCQSSTSQLVVNVRALGPLDQSQLADQNRREQQQKMSAAVAASLHRRLPHPTGDDILSQQQQQQQYGSSRPSSSITTTTTISQRSGSPKMTQRKTTTTTTVMNRSNRPTSTSMGPNVTNINSVTSSILSKKDNTNDRSRTSNISSNTASLNTLGYLDLDTKNVTFENKDKGGKRRRLPEVPKDEEPISAMINTKKLIKEKLSGRSPLVRSGAPLKSSSSLDSSFGIGPLEMGHYGSSSNPARPQSPYSSNSDITHFLTSTYGRHLKSPTNTDLAKVKHKSDTFLSSSSSCNKYNNDPQKTMTSSNFANEIKNIQQKILQELKTGEMNSTTNFLKKIAPSHSGRGSGQHGSTFSNQNEYNSYRNLLENSLHDNSSQLPRAGSWQRNTLNMPSQYGRSSSTSYNQLKNQLFKSYEFESLNPVRLSDDKYRLTRPMSSILFHDNATAAGLRDSSFNNKNNDLSRLTNMFDYKRYNKYDTLNSLYKKYDLATASGLDNGHYNRYGYHHPNENDFLYGFKNKTSRSWHPSPYGSDDEDYDQNLSVEEKTAKVRAEIKRRRQRLADSDRLYRHYSFDDYNFLNQTDSNRDHLNTLNYLISQSDTNYDYEYSPLNDYSLIESKEKYYSDDLDAYYNHKNGSNYYYPHSSYAEYGPGLTSSSCTISGGRHPSQHNRMYDSRLTHSMYGTGSYPHEDNCQMNPYGASSMPLLASEQQHGPSTIGYNRFQRKPTMTTMAATTAIDDFAINNGYLGSGYESNEYNYMRSSPKKTQFALNSTRNPKYPFPIKRILLTQDPKIRSMDGDGLGLKVIGGREIPGTNMIGAYIAKIHPSLCMNGEIHEGMQVIEWNGIPLTGISHDEVSRIISNQIGDEIEVVIRTDINLLQDHYNHYNSNMIAGGHCGGGPPPPAGVPYGPSYDHGAPGGVGYGCPTGAQPYYPPSSAAHHQMGGPPPPPLGSQYNYHHPLSSSNKQTHPAHHQPQVILQHNHPVDESLLSYDQYGNRIGPPPLPPHMMGPGGGMGHQYGPLPPPQGQMGPMGPPLSHHQQQQQHRPNTQQPQHHQQPPPNNNMTHQTPPSQPPIDNSYYSH